MPTVLPLTKVTVKPSLKARAYTLHPQALALSGTDTLHLGQFGKHAKQSAPGIALADRGDRKTTQTRPDPEHWQTAK